MKKFSTILLVFVMLFCLVGCDSNKETSKEDEFSSIFYASYEKISEDKRFLCISSCNGYIFVDKQTKVQYLYIKEDYSGGLTVLVDTDGKPLLYDE